jgi:hypothetical protein
VAMKKKFVGYFRVSTKHQWLDGIRWLESLECNPARPDGCANQKPHWLNLKNCCEPEMGLVTVFCPFMITVPEATGIHTGETRLVQDSTFAVVRFVGHVNTTFRP